MHAFLFADSAGRLEQLVIRCLAVGGAFLVGNYGMGIFLKLTARFYFKRLLPPWVVAWSRMGNGLLCAILAAMILFGDGGFGLGGSGGGKPGGPQSTDRTAKSDDAAPKVELKAEPVIPPVVPEDEKVESRLRIVVLGGSQADDRYYLVGDAKEPISFDSLKDLLLARVRDTAKPLRRIDIPVYKNAAFRDSYLVRQLETWAKDNRLSVNFPPVSDENMPERP